MHINLKGETMRRARVFFIVSLCLAASFFAGCTKNVAGPKGDPGTPGKSGNLLQTHVNIAVPATAWSLNINTWEASAYVPEIAKLAVDKGEVKVYIKMDSKWCGMPYGDGYVFTQYAVEKEFIHFSYTHIHGGMVSKPADLDFRVVVFSPAE